MRDWQAIAEHISNLFKPEADSSVFHYDLDAGALLVNFVEGITQEEFADFQSARLEWRVVSFGGLFNLCHSFPGRSWNDTPISLYADESGLQALLDLALAELPLTYLVLDADSGRLLISRNCVLTPSIVFELQAGLRLQKELGLDALLEAEKLGDATEAMHDFAVPGMPKIISVKVDEEKRTTQIKVKSPVEQARDEPRPRWLLRSIAANPNLDFKDYEVRVARYVSRGETVPWRYCFFPVDEIRDSELEKMEFALTDQLAGMGIRGADATPYLNDALGKASSSNFPYVYLAIMLSWRQGQGIYRFDPELLKTLFLTTLPIHLSPEIFTRLPEFCAYVETPGVKTEDGYPLHGFFAMAEGNLVLDDATLEPREERRMYVLLDVADSAAGLSRQRIVSFSLDPPTLSAALETMQEITDEGYMPLHDLVEWLSPLLSQLLYLCSDEPEILHQSGPRREIEKPTPTKTRKGYKIFVPTVSTVWACGWRLGSLIRNAKIQAAEQKAAISAGEQRISPRGHTRRAHWHLFWAGKRDAAVREPRVKYLPMLKINLKDEDGPPPTVIRRVSA